MPARPLVWQAFFASVAAFWLAAAVMAWWLV
jgi:hypothetical protein